MDAADEGLKTPSSSLGLSIFCLFRFLIYFFMSSAIDFFLSFYLLILFIYLYLSVKFGVVVIVIIVTISIIGIYTWSVGQLLNRAHRFSSSVFGSTKYTASLVSVFHRSLSQRPSPATTHCHPSLSPVTS